jgi:CheY-like chemotaxis protein
VDQSPPAAAESETSIRVLVVDDNPTNRRVLEMILEIISARTVCVENGALAVAEVQRAGFDVILMDLQMPVMDGLAATRAIRDLECAMHRRRTPILVVSANTLPRDVEASREAGADRHLAKPVMPQELLGAVMGATLH